MSFLSVLFGSNVGRRKIRARNTYYICPSMGNTYIAHLWTNMSLRGRVPFCPSRRSPNVNLENSQPWRLRRVSLFIPCTQDKCQAWFCCKSWTHKSSKHLGLEHGNQWLPTRILISASTSLYVVKHTHVPTMASGSSHCPGIAPHQSLCSRRENIQEFLLQPVYSSQGSRSETAHVPDPKTRLAFAWWIMSWALK